MSKSICLGNKQPRINGNGWKGIINTCNSFISFHATDVIYCIAIWSCLFIQIEFSSIGTIDDGKTIQLLFIKYSGHHNFYFPYFVCFATVHGIEFQGVCLRVCVTGKQVLRKSWESSYILHINNKFSFTATLNDTHDHLIFYQYLVSNITLDSQPLSL